MAENRVRRRLAAILAADMVGYSRLMEADESGTHARLKSLRADLFDPTVARLGGRIFKTTGDGALAEFASAIDAVQCAIDIQNALTRENAGAPPDGRIQFRIGISLGDVIVEGEDLYGNGVNVAARLEGLSAPGEISVSANVHEHIGNALAVGFEDLGEQQVKNLNRPVRCYRVVQGADAGTPPGADPAPHRSADPDMPSIVVLPFDNLSSDPEQGYFADGMTEDLITDLSKISGLFVIARNTSFAFKGQARDITEIGRRLGVRHVLEGSVRRAGNRVRINAQLIDAATGGHLWAERYDGDFEDIFALQDDISAKIISALELHLTSADHDKVERKPTRSTKAYDLLLRGRAEYYAYSPTHMANARRYFEKAIEIDPECAEAYGYLSYCRTSAYLFAWPDADPTLETALELAEKSVALDTNSAVAHTRLGWVQGYVGQIDAARENFAKAIALDPRNAEAFYAFGETLNRAGTPEPALPLLQKAFELEPIAPLGWRFAEGHAFILMGRFDEAAETIAAVIERLPFFLPGRVQLARVLGETGRTAEAREQVAAILERSPAFTIANAAAMFPYPERPEARRRLCEILDEAGMPG